MYKYVCKNGKGNHSALLFALWWCCSLLQPGWWRGAGGEQAGQTNTFKWFHFAWKTAHRICKKFGLARKADQFAALFPFRPTLWAAPSKQKTERERETKRLRSCTSCQTWKPINFKLSESWANPKTKKKKKLQAKNSLLPALSVSLVLSLFLSLSPARKCVCVYLASPVCWPG